MRRSSSSSRTKLLAGLLAPAAALAAGPVTDPATGLDGWSLATATADFTLNQRLPDQSRAYFMGRGFGQEAAEKIAAACVFQAIIRNPAGAPGELAIDVGGFRVRPAGGAPRPPKIEPVWQKEWEQAGASQAARIAFRYSLFPTTQQFEPGDWNMGMITMDLPAGARFDLELNWLAAGKPQQGVIEGMVCAPDRPVAP